MLLTYRFILGDEAYIFETFLARRVRTDQRRVEGAGAGGGPPGSIASEGHSLHVDRHIDVEKTQGGRQHDTNN
jgi:hypothetical protein